MTPRSHSVLRWQHRVRFKLWWRRLHDTLTVVDVALQTPLATIDLGLARAPRSRFCRRQGRWLPLSPPSHRQLRSRHAKIDWILGTGQNRTHMIYVSPDAETHRHHQYQLRYSKHHEKIRHARAQQPPPEFTAGNCSGRAATPAHPRLTK